MIGHVYKARGGRGTTAYWIVLSVINRYAICLGVDEEMNIVGCAKYGVWYLEEKTPVAIINIENLRILE